MLYSTSTCLENKYNVRLFPCMDMSELYQTRKEDSCIATIPYGMMSIPHALSSNNSNLIHPCTVCAHVFEPLPETDVLALEK